MLKYLNSDVVFQEVPGEVTLAINLTGCPCRCPGCHSQALWGNGGENLTTEALDHLIAQCSGHITCVALMGGDGHPDEVNGLMNYVRKSHHDLRTAWYSGRSLLSDNVDLHNFDYIKLGPYLAHLGGLKSRKTNQKMYRIEKGQMRNITNCFWK